MQIRHVGANKRFTKRLLTSSAQHVHPPWLHVRVAWGCASDIKNVNDVFLGDCIWTKNANGFPRSNNRIKNVNVRMHLMTGLRGFKDIYMHSVSMMAQPEHRAR